MSATEEKPNEGWQTYKSEATRRFHYIDSQGMALCRGLGFYMAEKTPHQKGVSRGPEDCAKCYKLVEAR